MLQVDSLKKPPKVELELSGSKSITNRALVIASLAQGTSTLKRALFAEDTLAMIGCLEEFGIQFEADESVAKIVVHGSKGNLKTPSDSLWVRQSGTTARFMLALAALVKEPVGIDGDEQIRARPQTDLLNALSNLGVKVSYDKDLMRLPLIIDGSKLEVSDIEINGETSSQYLSALLLVAPCLPEQITFTLTGNAVSLPYIKMTVKMMEAFGAEIDSSKKGSFTVLPTGYRGRDYEIETDASTASYFFAAAAASKGSVTVHGIGKDSIQGDLRFTKILQEMGAKVSLGENSVGVSADTPLKGVEVSMKDFSDTAPTLAAISPYATSAVTVTEIGFIKHKESDRINAIVTELQKLGVEANIEEDGFTIQPSNPVGTQVHAYDDHRIAMAFTVLGLLTEGVWIDDPNCVAKTCPNFYEYIDALRLEGDQDLDVLAIDGPAGSGKSSLAKLVAKELGLEYLDTGAMYRSVAAEALAAKVNPEDYQAVTQIADGTQIEFDGQRVLVNGSDATDLIRSAEVNAIVSYVAANPGVRAILRRAQRSWARERGGGVLEGRDIGSVVFPRAKLKVFVTATPEERARRRSLESGRALEEILTEIKGRDEIDSSRADSPLSVSSNAIIVDTTDKTLNEVAEEILRKFNV